MPDSQRMRASPVARFFAAMLMVVGVLMMLLCGGCGALFFVGFLFGGLFSSNHEDIGMVILPLLLGGVPAAIGFGLFAVGRSISRTGGVGPRPPPSSPPNP